MVDFHQRAGIDEDVVRVHDESVERPVVDDHDMNVLVAETGNAQNGRRVFAQELLDLGVANHRDAGAGSGLRPQRGAGQRHPGNDGKRDGARQLASPAAAC